MCRCTCNEETLYITTLLKKNVVVDLELFPLKNLSLLFSKERN